MDHLDYEGILGQALDYFVASCPNVGLLRTGFLLFSCFLSEWQATSDRLSIISSLLVRVSRTDTKLTLTPTHNTLYKSPNLSTPICFSILICIYEETGQDMIKNA